MAYTEFMDKSLKQHEELIVSEVAKLENELKSAVSYKFNTTSDGGVLYPALLPFRKRSPKAI
jgi:hypothetical protein